jgi:hypothetical protein
VVSDSESLARGLGPEAVAALLKILRRSRPADVHVLIGPVRGKRRSVEVCAVEKITSSGDGDSIAIDAGAC